MSTEVKMKNATVARLCHLAAQDHRRVRLTILFEGETFTNEGALLGSQDIGYLLVEDIDEEPLWLTEDMTITDVQVLPEEDDQP